MWIKQIVSMASPDNSYPPGCVRQVDEGEGERLMAAGFAVPSEQPSEHAAVEAAERSVASKASSKKAPKKR